MNATDLFLSTVGGFGDEYAPLVVTADMRSAHQGDDIISHDMRPAFHPIAMPNWRDCLSCWVCGYTLVTQRMFEQAPLWAKVYLAALYLESWLELIEEAPEEPV